MMIKRLHPFLPLISLVINCTSLMVDPGGPLRMRNCSNHYGSKCNFSCAAGYRLNGSSTVTCVAPGNRPPGKWDHPVPVCKGRLIYFGNVMSCTTDKLRDCSYVNHCRRDRENWTSLSFLNTSSSRHHSVYDLNHSPYLDKGHTWTT